MSILRILLPLVREEHINANTVTKDFLEQIFFAPESSPVLRGELLQQYGIGHMTERIAKNLYSLQLPMTKEIFFAAWNYLSHSERLDLMAACADLLGSEDFERCFDDMDEPHHDFVDRTKHKVRISKTDVNEKIAQRLKDIDYITSFADEANPATEDDSIEATVLVCWVKAIS